MAAFLEEHGATIKETTIANKTRYEGDKALELARNANQVYVAKGKKLYQFDMKKDPPAEEELLRHLLGPHGNLRAPVVVSGKKVFVGFHATGFEELF